MEETAARADISWSKLCARGAAGVLLGWNGPLDVDVVEAILNFWAE